jgi:succinyl-diaminopimelate desuccinylase
MQMSTIENFLKKLVSFRSITSDRQANVEQIDWLASALEKNLIVERFVQNGYPSLVAFSNKVKRPKVFLVGHGDVVPGPDDGFNLKQKENRLIGRGVLDMKFALACFLRLIEELQDDLSKLDFGIMITSDEEVGGSDGVGWLLEQGFSSDFAFIPDGGTNWYIESGAKGLLHLDIEATGKSAHASRPWEGESPVMNLFDFLKELQQTFTPEHCDGEEHYHDTMTIGKIVGGEAINQVPASLIASVDIRYIPETGKNIIDERIKAIQENYNNIIIRERAYGAAILTDLTHPAVQIFQKIATDKGIKIFSAFSHGASDARFFDNKGIPTLVVWPKGGGHHSDEEWIDIQSMEMYYQILKQWVQKVA